MPHAPPSAGLERQPRVKPERHKLYASALWQRTRTVYLGRHPLCANCERLGRITLAVDVHHIVALKDGGHAWDFANLEGLCKACHLRETAAGR